LLAANRAALLTADDLHPGPASLLEHFRRVAATVQADDFSASPKWPGLSLAGRALSLN
jgi:hypothetical protein